VEEAAAGAAVGLRHFDAHHAEVEQVADERLRERGLLVHFPHERAHARLRELPDAVAEDAFVFGKNRQRLGEFGGILRHGAGSPLRNTQCYH
jgi:hypothetical protein